MRRIKPSKESKMQESEKELLIIHCKLLVTQLEGRLNTLLQYENVNIGKEILGTRNDIKRYKLLLNELEKI